MDTPWVTVWESLILNPEGLDILEISCHSGLEDLAVRRGLAELKKINLLKVLSPAPRAVYGVCISLNALQWAQAVEAGFPLEVLEQHASLEDMNLDEAIRVATDGTLHQIKEDRIQKKRDARRKALMGRVASEVAASDVAKLAQDLQLALSDFNKSKNPKKDLHARSALMVLETAHQAALHALSELEARLLKNRGGEV